MHYARWLRTGHPERRGRPRNVCKISECDELVKGRGWCNMHYLTWRRHGDPEKALTGDDEARFWSYVEKTEDCWLWVGAIGSSGYGRLKVAGRDVGAHRFAFELLVGPIPEGLTIDHLCRNRPCVKPDHLEPVTLAENTRRANKAQVG
jgi:hypothetical protein